MKCEGWQGNWPGRDEVEEEEEEEEEKTERK